MDEIILQQLMEFGKGIGPTAVVGVFAIYVLWQLLKEKRANSNGETGNNKDVIRSLNHLKGNCLKDIDKKLGGLESNGRRIVELLIEIKTLLTK